MSEITVAVGMAEKAIPENGRRWDARKRRFWLGWVIAFAGGGLISGIAALSVSFLTACGLMQSSRMLGFVVSGMLVGCFAAFLLAANGMDRVAAMRKEQRMIALEGRYSRK